MDLRYDRVQHRRITEIIKRRIIKGQYDPSEKMPSENELIKEFRVSKHTLLKALNALINQGYIIRRQGSGTFVSTSWGEHKNKKIGVIVHHITNPYYSKIIMAIEDYLFGRGFGVILCNSKGVPQKENECIARFIDEADGFIIAPTEEQAEYSAGVKNIFESETPLVFFAHTALNQLTDRTNYVVPDNCAGGFFAGRHLAECGYKKMRILISNLKKETERERIKGFRLAMLQYRIPFDDSCIIEIPATDQNNGYMKDAYNVSPEIAAGCQDEPVGIFALTDPIAIGLLRGLREIGLDIPGRVGICGFDDIELSAQLGIELTTVAQDTVSIGKKAAEIIMEILEHPKENLTPRHIVIPVELKVRKTTAVLSP
ncbi:MAG: GntR family transcriptional regulator [Victivallaceae bacterium]|nr:GntR family transcriptional regulator [Victivallaceae bacterium]